MRINSYSQKLLAMGLQSAQAMEPITFCGMYDCGVDYLFTLSEPLLSAELRGDINPVFVDLSGLSSREGTEAELAFALTEVLPEVQPSDDYFSLSKKIRAWSDRKKIVMVIYLGQDGGNDPGLFLFLNRLRNLLGWKFSYILFATGRLLLSKNYDVALMDRTLKRNLVPVLPRDESDSSITLENYEERFKKPLEEKMRKKILDLSGGNPGLIKALYLQAKENSHWTSPDFSDGELSHRFQGITLDLPPRYLSLLASGVRIKESIIRDNLIFFGYLVKKDKALRPFSPLWLEFVKKYGKRLPADLKKTIGGLDSAVLHLSQSQRKVFAYLGQHPGEIVSRDKVAEILWGENWHERYSDWAIDQLIFAIREKMGPTKIKGKLVTKKGEGIIYLPG